MRLVMSVTSALLLVAAASGCSSSTGPLLLAGKWSEDSAIPENSLQMTFSVNGPNISGSGNWCGDALGCGTTSVTGTISGNTVRLVTTFDNGLIEYFDGSLKSLSSLEGSVIDQSPGGQPQLPHAQTFHRG